MVDGAKNQDNKANAYTDPAHANNGAGSSSAPPPPYSNTPQVIYPAGRISFPDAPQSPPAAPPSRPQQYYQQTASQAESAGIIVYISPEELALARARRRFFSAVFWAFIIYLVLGALFGDSIAEANRERRRHPGNGGHWDKHGRWHDGPGKVVVYSPGTAATSVIDAVPESALA